MSSSIKKYGSLIQIIVLVLAGIFSWFIIEPSGFFSFTGFIILVIVIAVIAELSWFVINLIPKYMRELKKDDQELRRISIYNKFSALIDGLNEYCYFGQGDITKIDKRTISLYKEGSCQILRFQYNGGMLTILWRFKYYQQEMKYERNFTNVREITEDEQLQYLKIVNSEFMEAYKKHKAKVDASGKPEQILKEFGISKENLHNARAALRDIND